MTRAELIAAIHDRKSFLCVGLDPDIQRLPLHLLDLDDPVFEFNKAVIDATRAYCVAYKPNFAFYEALGVNGWISLEKTIQYIGKDHLIIADAKRGDIGNTAKKYAQSVFENLGCDAITLSPYMGSDSVDPFLAYKDKWAVLLALTSNPSSTDFQTKKLVTDDLVFEEVLQESSKWENADRIMYVVGATKPEYLEMVRRWAPNNFLLIPGIGAQGGDLDAVCKAGLNKDIGLIINVARGIIYAGEGKDFKESVGDKARSYQQQLATYL